MPLPSKIKPYLHKAEDINLAAAVYVVHSVFSQNEIRAVEENPGTGIKASLSRKGETKLTLHVYVVKERKQLQYITCLLEDSRQLKLGGVRIRTNLLLAQ